MPRLPLICLALLCAAPLPAAVKVEKFQVAGADVTLKVPEKRSGAALALGR